LALLPENELRALRIVHMVLHEVGPKDEDFKLFEGEVEAGDLTGFFIDRLVEANKGSAYEFEAESKVLAALRAVDSRPEDIVEQGRAVATLFNNEHSGHVLAGSFAIFALAGGAAKYYALVKFDHRPVAVLDDTTTRARLELVRKTIVESPEAMQKSALVQLGDDGGALAVRDRRGSRKIPEYFVRFLQVRRRFSESELTKKLSEVIKEVAEKNEQILGARFLDTLPTKIYNAVHGAETFDAAREDIMVSVFGPQPEDSPIRSSFTEHLVESGLEHEQFDIDKTVVSQPTRRRILTVEGIEIRYAAALQDRVEEVQMADGTTQIRINTARVEKHEQLP
jgi:hypothetical protein